jgi:hypothetical protein
LEIEPLNMTIPKLIYCAGGNKKFAEIAIKSGYLYGSRLPKEKLYFPIYFADQNWKKPDRVGYMEALKKNRPHMATVLDIEKINQVKEVLSWAEEASQFCEEIVIIPKVKGIIKKIPHRINKKDIVLGFSVPTRYGKTSVSKEDFKGRRIHFLGGSPHAQIKLWQEMKMYSDITSSDGNYVQKMAVLYNHYWTNGDAFYARNRWFPRLDEADGKKWKKNAPYEAFRRSCENIKDAWQQLAKSNKCNI